MKAIADENISDLDDTFAREVILEKRPGRALEPKHLGHAEVLLVRSVTRVDASLLSGSRIRFVGTATIGTDHLDTKWLDDAGIAWAAAPGCNADAAAQYTLGMYLLACRRLGRDPVRQSVGIIGYGNVGRRVARLMQTLGIQTLINDPPLEAEQRADDPPFSTLEATLACDAVTVHAPLTWSGPWPTAGLIDRTAFQAMREGVLLINCARGGIVEGKALLESLSAQRIFAALDVWPEEPRIARELLAATTVATPHVAGYSVEGKARGTQMIFEAFLRWSGRSDTLHRDDRHNEPTIVALPLPRPFEGPLTLSDTVIAATKVEADDLRLRAVTPDSHETFDALRRAHTPRHEFSRIELPSPGAIAPLLRALGFRVREPMA